MGAVCLLTLVAVILAAMAGPTSAQLAGPLRVNPANPRYFTDNTGKSILLVGSHTWANLVDNGFLDPPTLSITPPISTSSRPTATTSSAFTPRNRPIPSTTPPRRTSTASRLTRAPDPASPSISKPRFDVSTFDQSFFDRLRQRVLDAGARGIYVSVMLFNGWSVEAKGQVTTPWVGHPLNSLNNINGVNGDPNGAGNGLLVHTLADAGLVAPQETYVRKVIDTVNDLDNVLYEICNECNTASLSWEQHMVAFVKNYEAGLPKQHPVGMTVEWPDGTNGSVFASNADWVSPNGGDGYASNPPAADGSKVVVADTDHIFGIGGDRAWVWRSFMRGLNLLFMDGAGSPDYVSVASPAYDVNDPTWVSLRANMGYARAYARTVNLTAMVPHGELTSTRYALASPGSATPEYLIYSEGGSFTVDLTANPGPFSVEWLNPATGAKATQSAVAGGIVRSFSTPFSGDGVLYLRLASITDTQPPTIAIVSPTVQSTFLTNTSPLTVSGTAADNVGVTQVTWVNLAGGSGTAGGTTSWSVPNITLQPGVNVLIVTALDASGNVSTVTLTVTYDTVAPDTTITANPPATTNSTSASFNFTATEAGSTFECRLDGGAFVVCVSPQSYGSLAAGSHTFQVRAIDPVGNADSTPASFSWVIDITPPTVAIATPTSELAFTTSSNTVTIGGTASDNLGVTQVTWANDRGGSGGASGTTTWMASGILLQVGANVITVTAHDAAGNTATSTVTAILIPPDTTPPTISITSPTTALTYNTSKILLTLGGIAADNVGVTQVTWSNARGGSGTANGTTIWTVNNIILRPGTNVLTVTARDAAGNTATTTLIAILTLRFTDDPLTPGMPNEAVHFTELRSAIDGVRLASGCRAATGRIRHWPRAHAREGRLPD